MGAPFHQLLSFYSNRSNIPDSQTIRFQDSLIGNLSLGLDFPVAFAVAIGRHLWLRNTGMFSLDIHVPSVTVTKTLLDGLHVDENTAYRFSEIVKWGAGNGILGRVEAMGLWGLASDVKSGLLAGEDVVGFQKGELFNKLERRRKTRDQVLPPYRGGPIW